MKSIKKNWQCPKCGTLCFKNESSLTLWQSGIPIIGSEVCPYCKTSQSTANVMGGKFDLYVSDELIAQATRDRANTYFNKDELTWYYKGQPLKGPASR